MGQHYIQGSEADGLLAWSGSAGTGREERRLHSIAVRGTQPVDSERTGHVLCRCHQRAPKHQTGGEQRPAFPHAARRCAIYSGERNATQEGAGYPQGAYCRRARDCARQARPVGGGRNRTRRGDGDGPQAPGRMHSGRVQERGTEPAELRHRHHNLHQRHYSRP